MVVGPIPSDDDIVYNWSERNPCSHPRWNYHPNGIAGRECRFCGHRELLYRAPCGVRERSVGPAPLPSVRPLTEGGYHE